MTAMNQEPTAWKRVFSMNGEKKWRNGNHGRLAANECKVWMQQTEPIQEPKLWTPQTLSCTKRLVRSIKMMSYWTVWKPRLVSDGSNGQPTKVSF